MNAESMMAAHLNAKGFVTLPEIDPWAKKQEWGDTQAKPVLALPAPTPQQPFRTLDAVSTLKPLCEIRITVQDVINGVSRVTGFKLNDLTSPRRWTTLAEARQIIMYLSRELTDKSLPQIGRALGRDHTTVLHGIKRVKENMDRLKPLITRCTDDIILSVDSGQN